MSINSLPIFIVNKIIPFLDPINIYVLSLVEKRFQANYSLVQAPQLYYNLTTKKPKNSDDESADYNSPVNWHNSSVDWCDYLPIDFNSDDNQIVNTTSHNHSDYGNDDYGFDYEDNHSDYGYDYGDYDEPSTDSDKEAKYFSAFDNSQDIIILENCNHDEDIFDYLSNKNIDFDINDAGYHVPFYGKIESLIRWLKKKGFAYVIINEEEAADFV